MYPLKMRNDAIGGYAAANDAAEHARLSEMGYEPKFVAPEPEADPSEADGEGHTVASVRAALDAAGIAYDKRLGLAKLLALLPA
jgi:hypothetical protein